MSNKIPRILDRNLEKLKKPPSFDVREAVDKFMGYEVKPMTLESAIALAANAHRGQRDKAGRPYILHPLRVMLKMKTDEERMTAILHDVVEDTPWTLEGLTRAQVPINVVIAVGFLTRKKEQNEIYMEYIHRVCRNWISLAVKIEDLKDNLNLNRLSPELIAANVSYFKREKKALSYCLSAWRDGGRSD